MSEHLKIWTKLAERLTEYFGEEVIRTVDHPVQTMGGKFSFAEPKVHPVSGDPYEVEVSGDLTFRNWTFKYYHPFNPNDMAWINMRAADVSEDEAADIAFLIMTKPMALRYKYISCIYNRYWGFDYQRTLKAIEESSSFKIKWDPHRFCYEKVKPNIAKLALKIAEYEHVSISEDTFDPLSLDVYSFLPAATDGDFEDPVGLNIKTEWASFFPENTPYTESPIVKLNSREYKMEFRAEETYTSIKKYGSLPETDDIRILAAYFRYLMDTDHVQLTYIIKRIYDRKNIKNGKDMVYGGYEYMQGLNALYWNEKEELWTAAEFLADNNYVSLNPYKDKIYFSASLQGVKKWEKWKDEEVEWIATYIKYGRLGLAEKTTAEKWSLLRSPEPGDEEDKLDTCIRMAAYVDYLKSSGTYTEFTERRREALEYRKQSFTYLIKENPGVSNLINQAQNVTQNYLYACLQGDYSGNKSEITKLVGDALSKAGKITTTKNYAMLELAAKLAKINPHRPADIPRNNLIVLTDVREFVFKAEKLTEGDGSPESHLLKLLGRLHEDTYIIIVGERKYIQRLINLNSRINFIYGNNLINIKNYTPEKIYTEFRMGLTRAYKAKLNDEFKNDFIEYVTYNEKLLPYSNRELALYLSDYVKRHRKLCLPPNYYKEVSAKEKLESVVGMGSIKQAVNEFENLMLFRKRAAMEGMEIPDSNMHMLFTGSPGTGKTMTARIIAQMLYDLGIIEENKTVEASSKDLVGQYVGHTANLTNKKIQEAMGGVLFIDEAYDIANSKGSNSDYGAECIATLIKAMEDYKDKFIVIFAGYEKEMSDFLEVNPGLSSRIGYKFHFPDYTSDEMVEMFRRKAVAAGFTVTDEALEKVKKTAEVFSRKRNFGNGRFVDRLIADTIRKHAQDTEAEDISKLSEEDIPGAEELAAFAPAEKADYKEKLKNVVGMEDIKSQLKKFESSIQFQVLADKKGIKLPSVNRHMLFIGNPGTGKTMVARLISDMLYDIGIVREKKCVEVTAKDLIAAHVGGTSEKTAKIIERALGGVLFIDEAYQMLGARGDNYNASGDSIAELIKAMEDKKEDLIVIFAGYKKEMYEFVASNPGIKSRIGFTFTFSDYNADELTEIFTIKMEGAGFTVAGDAKEKVRKLCQYFCNVENFGNGRFIDKVMQRVIDIHSENFDMDKIELIEASDIPDISELIKTMPGGKAMVSPDDITDEQRRRTAVHESGHALAMKVLIPKAKIHTITVNAEGTGTLGYVEKENTLGITNTRTDYYNNVIIYLAGIAAEKLILGEFADGGAGGDIPAAKSLIEYMVRAGMSKHGIAGPATEEEKLKEINEVLGSAFDDAVKLLEEKKVVLEKAAAILVNDGSLDEDTFMNLMS